MYLRHHHCPLFNIWISLPSTYFKWAFGVFYLFVFSLRAQTISHTVCTGDHNVKRYFVNNAQSGAQYEWLLSSGGTIVSTQADTAFVVWNSIPGIYPIKLVVSLGALCVSDTAEYWIEIIEKPTLAITGLDTVCVGAKVTLTATGEQPIKWSNGSTNPVTDFYPGSPITVWAVSGTGQCKSDTAYFSIFAQPQPLIQFTLTPTSGEVPLTVDFQNQTINATFYTWYFGDGTISNEAQPVHSYVESGNYQVTLIAENEAGCITEKNYSFIKVSELFAVFVPSAFTPGNTDNLNTVFTPVFTEPVVYQLDIFNRWGQLIFSEKSKTASWDGTYLNREVMDGLYMYELHFINPIDGYDQHVSGTISVLRN